MLQLVSHPTTGPRHFRVTSTDYGPDGLLEQGQRHSIRRSRRTVLRDYGPKEAASSRRRAVGTTGTFQGLRALTAPVEAMIAETAVADAVADAVASTRTGIATLQAKALAVAVAAAVAWTVMQEV